MASRDHEHRTPRNAIPSGHPTPFGPYLLERRIAVGGMSEVYLATPAAGTSPAPVLVIKRLLPAILEDPSSRRTFATEARLHTAAQHPNVVKIFEAAEVDGEPYLAMEYVPGVDAFRMMRRAQTERRLIETSLAVYIARELCKALDCVHALTDEEGRHLGIVHRDVTPSNVYLSQDGDVKLGDFGIARTALKKTGSPASYVLKGKYAYLAPEQVSGEAFDHRSDLFSLVVAFSEMLMGQALFPGAGQLAVLLAIRDCRIDPLRAIAHRLPRGLMGVLEKGLARAPDDRYSSASELFDALRPFQDADEPTLRANLAARVASASDSSLLARHLEGAIRESTKIAVAVGPATAPVPAEPAERITLAPQPIVLVVRTQEGRLMPDLSFAKLIELVVTGQLTAADEVDMNDSGFQRLETIDVLARHLPPSTATTTRLDGPGIPDYAAELSTTPMLEVLAWLLTRRERGALFADRGDGARGLRKELYFDQGKLIMAASSEPSELLGEYLVRSGAIDRAELEMALAALSVYEGRLGDTLIGLGLVGPVEMFHAIRNQGRAKVAEIFRWPSGRVTFYRGVTPQRVDFRLDLDIPDLMLAGLEDADGNGDARPPMTLAEDEELIAVRPPPDYARAVSWPAAVITLSGFIGLGKPYKEALRVLTTSANLSRPDALHAIEIAIAGGLVRRRRPAAPTP